MESEKWDKYHDLVRELKKTIEHESDSDTNDNWCDRYSEQGVARKTRELGNKRTRRDHLNYSITKIGQSTEKSPGDLGRFSVTQNPVRSDQLTLVWKISKEVKWW